MLRDSSSGIYIVQRWSDGASPNTTREFRDRIVERDFIARNTDKQHCEMCVIKQLKIRLIAIKTVNCVEIISRPELRW